MDDTRTGIASLCLAAALGAALLFAAPRRERARRGARLRAAAHGVAADASDRVAAASGVAGAASAALAGPVHVRAARRMNRAAGTLAMAVLADSAIEHYRGAFHNRAMLLPLVGAAASLGVSAHGNADPRASAHGVRDSVYAAAVVIGLAGTGFHVYNILKRPGGFGWQNLFYGAPLGAPAALVLSGATGYLAERVRHAGAGRRPRLAGVGAGRAVAAATALGIAGTAGEAALLHFRGAYHDPFMYAPVTVPPVTAALLARAALAPSSRRHRLTRFALRLTALLGLIGIGFHAFGVSRNMGGWRNWKQNLLNGPPLPAPPSFTGLALSGLAGLGLLEAAADE